jgi:hypothetical protein
MKTWVSGNETRGFLLSIDEPEKDQDEVAIMETALKQLRAVKVRFQITSLDSYDEEYIVGKSILKLESSNWDTAVICKDKDVILAMKGIIEKMDSDK